MHNEDIVSMAIPVKIVDSAATIIELIDSLSDLPVDPPSLFVDLEGEYLSRTGPILIITLFVEPQKVIYLVDVWVLRKLAFTTSGKDGKTMKDILESASIQKYNISLQGIQDVQLMEKALHPVQFPARPFTSLVKCIEKDVLLPQSLKMIRSEQKAKGKMTFKGGSFKAFKATVAYCTGDVQHLPALRKTYWERLSPGGKIRAEAETRARTSSPARAQTPEITHLQARQAVYRVTYNPQDEGVDDHGLTTKAMEVRDWEW